MAGMPAESRKRVRQECTMHSARVSFSERIKHVPACWRHAATAAGVASTDEFVRLVGRSVAEESVALTEAAEAARGRLREARLVIHAAVDARFDELELKLNAVHAAKAAALERKLVAVDAALENWRTDSANFTAAVSALSDSELETQRTALSSRLDDMEARLQALPTHIVEPPLVGLVADTSALLDSVAGFGRVLAPLCVTAEDLSIESAYSSHYAGDVLLWRLTLGSRHAAQSTDEVEVSLVRLVAMTSVDASLEADGDEPQTLAFLPSPPMPPSAACS